LIIGHLKNKPSIERILEAINEAAKIEFDFILNGLNIDLVEIEPEEVIQLIDRKTKELKNSVIKNNFIYLKDKDIIYIKFILDYWLL
jgi:hypothetical protein